MKTRTKVEMSYVVRDESGRVVVIFSGPAAPEEASSWAERGYQVTPAVLD